MTVFELWQLAMRLVWQVCITAYNDVWGLDARLGILQ